MITSHLSLSDIKDGIVLDAIKFSRNDVINYFQMLNMMNDSCHIEQHIQHALSTRKLVNFVVFCQALHKATIHHLLVWFLDLTFCGNPIPHFLFIPFVKFREILNSFCYRQLSSVKFNLEHSIYQNNASSPLVAHLGVGFIGKFCSRATEYGE